MSLFSRESQSMNQPTLAMTTGQCVCGSWFLNATPGISHLAILMGVTQPAFPSYPNIYQLAYEQAVRTTLASRPGRHIEESLN